MSSKKLLFGSQVNPIFKHNPSIYVNGANVVEVGGYVTQMNDLSDNGNHLVSVQHTAPTLPFIDNGINSKSCVSIGNGNYLYKATINSLPLQSSNFTFMVFKIISELNAGYNNFYVRGVSSFSVPGSGFQQLYKVNGGTSFISNFSNNNLDASLNVTTGLTHPQLMCQNKKVLDFVYSIGNQEITRTGGNNIGSGELYIGNWFNNPAEMLLAEFGIINTITNPLTSLDILEIKNYLTKKYQL